MLLKRSISSCVMTQSPSSAPYSFLGRQKPFSTRNTHTSVLSPKSRAASRIVRLLPLRLIASVLEYCSISNVLKRSEESPTPNPLAAGVIFAVKDQSDECSYIQIQFREFLNSFMKVDVGRYGCRFFLMNCFFH